MATGIWNCNLAARILTPITIIGSVATLTGHGETAALATQFIVALAILVLLYTGRARENFGPS